MSADCGRMPCAPTTSALMAWAASLERFVREREERKLMSERLVAAFGVGVRVAPIRFELAEGSYSEDSMGGRRG